MTDCAAPRHPDDNRPETEPNSDLCRPCRLGLTADLRRLPALDHHLSILTLIAATPGNGTLPLPFDADVSEWRSWFRRNITRTTLEVAAERHWALPADHPWAMCAWLEPQVRWVSFRDWAPRLADAFRKIRTRGEQLAAPLEIAHVRVGACLDCGNRVQDAVIYKDHGQGWSYWHCPRCGTVTPMEAWWDYPKRLAERVHAS